MGCSGASQEIDVAYTESSKAYATSQDRQEGVCPLDDKIEKLMVSGLCLVPHAHHVTGVSR